MAQNAFQRLQVKADQKAHLNPKYHGEACTFAPANFPNRTVTGNCAVNTVEDAGDSQELELLDELSFHCSRDTSGELGGIDAIKVGDAFYRSDEIDPDRRPFLATGEKRSVNALTWTLVFVRPKVEGLGFGN